MCDSSSASVQSTILASQQWRNILKHSLVRGGFILLMLNYTIEVFYRSIENEDEKTGRGKTRQWIRGRDERGYFNNIVKELAIEDTAEYKDMMRMSHSDFQRVLSYVEQDITRKQVLGGNKVISPKERLALTIRFLATGETYRSLSYQFRISTRSISYIIKEVCEAIIKNMRNIYLKVPTSPEEWLTVAEKFESRWQFPNCIGAIDGKHIAMQPPGNSGSYYYNYKHTFSSTALFEVALYSSC